MTLTVDASVWLAARFREEPYHEASADFLLRVIAGPELIALPWLSWVECVAAAARKTGGDDVAHQLGRHLRSLPGITWVPLDESLAGDACHLSARLRLRAADAVYVAVAKVHSSTLITLDNELLERCRGAVPCQTVTEWLRDN